MTLFDVCAIPQQNAVGQIPFEQSTENRTQTATMQCRVCNRTVRRMQKNTVQTAMQQISDVQRADIILANEQTTKHTRSSRWYKDTKKKKKRF